MHKRDSVSKLYDLPFVEMSDDGRYDLWNTEKLLMQDNATGRACADAAVAFSRDSGNHALVGQITQQMVRKADLGPVEIGFLHRLGEYAMVGGATPPRSATPPLASDHSGSSPASALRSGM